MKTGVVALGRFEILQKLAEKLSVPEESITITRVKKIKKSTIPLHVVYEVTYEIDQEDEN